MLSKGKKVMYRCPECDSENIYKRHVPPVFTALMRMGTSTLNMGTCEDCGVSFKWTKRIKISLKKLEYESNNN